jgi:serine/threonine-protein kinase
VLNVIFDVHCGLAGKGYIAVDFYDGSILYDFEQARVRLIDLDEYRLGPYRLTGKRNPGSRRFMAPEEFRPGALIDQVTNVYTLGRTAVEFLGHGQLSSETWRGNQIMLGVVKKAVRQAREGRQSSVAEFVSQWTEAVARGGF